MPHVIVKLWPGRTDDQKQRLTDTITRSVMDTLEYSKNAVSIAFEEVEPAEWTARAYEPNIIKKWAKLTKEPVYGARPKP